MLKLEFPNESHKEMYEELWDELAWLHLDFVHPDNIYEYRGERYSELLEKVVWDIEWTREWRVPASMFFAIENQKVIWAIQIRHSIDHPNLIFRWGHIGYGVRPSERQKWNATKMLELALKEAKKTWLEKVLVTCDVENIGSNKVIQANGGVLEKECLHEDGMKFNRYWIQL